MFFYQVAVLKFIKHFGLDELFKEDERIVMLRNSRKKKPVKKELVFDQKLNFDVTIVMSILSVLLFISLPFGILEDPCEIFKLNQYDMAYTLASFVNENFYIVDIALFLLIILLIRVVAIYILDAIKKTNINISPWIESGKYSLPTKQVIKKEEPLIDNYEDLIHIQQNNNIIFNGKYYESCGGILRERRLEEYRHTPPEICRNDRREMTIPELIMFERQYDLYRKRVLCEMKIKEREEKYGYKKRH